MVGEEAEEDRRGENMTKGRRATRQRPRLCCNNNTFLSNKMCCCCFPGTSSHKALHVREPLLTLCSSDACRAWPHVRLPSPPRSMAGRVAVTLPAAWAEGSRCMKALPPAQASRAMAVLVLSAC